MIRVRIPVSPRVVALVLLSAAVLHLGGCRLVGTPPPGSPASGKGPLTTGGSERPEGDPVGTRVGTSGPPASQPGSRSDAFRLTSNVVDTAIDAIGTPYVWGGTDDNGFDCSGLIQYAYALHGVEVPRVSRDQIRSGREVVPRREALLPGDILGFTRDVSRTVSHVGLYVGEGLFIHSSSSGVRVSNLGEPYWREHLVAATRVVW